MTKSTLLLVSQNTSAYNRFKDKGMIKVGEAMYDSEKLLQHLMQLNTLEKATLETGERDAVKLKEMLGFTDYKYNEKDIQQLSEEFYFRTNKGISYSRHPRFLHCSVHSHDFFEISYAYKGNFTQTINGEALTVHEGDLILLDTNVAHSIDPIDENTIVLNILMSKDYFNNKLINQFSDTNLITEFIISALYKKSLKGSYLHFELKGNSEIRGYVTAIIQELESDMPGKDEIINSFMTILFSMLAREKDCLRTKSSNAASSPAYIINILDYINENYMDLSLEKTAEHFHFSPNYVSHQLKKYTGKTFITIVLELKLEKAARLLHHTSFTIERIATICGFKNMNYFYKLFKDKYLCTPRQYRKK